MQRSQHIPMYVSQDGKAATAKSKPAAKPADGKKGTIRRSVDAVVDKVRGQPSHDVKLTSHQAFLMPAHPQHGSKATTAVGKSLAVSQCGRRNPLIHYDLFTMCCCDAEGNGIEGEGHGQEDPHREEASGREDGGCVTTSRRHPWRLMTLSAACQVAGLYGCTSQLHKALKGVSA